MVEEHKKIIVHKFQNNNRKEDQNFAIEHSKLLSAARNAIYKNRNK